MMILWTHFLEVFFLKKTFFLLLLLPYFTLTQVLDQLLFFLL